MERNKIIRLHYKCNEPHDSPLSLKLNTDLSKLNLVVGQSKKLELDFSISNTGKDPAYGTEMTFHIGNEFMAEPNRPGCKKEQGGGGTSESNGVNLILRIGASNHHSQFRLHQ